jgi:peptide/nickel transport system ATP-binding protein
LLEARGLELRYPGARRGWLGFGRRQPAVQALAGIDLAVMPGETVAVVGGSGSGKTTLGRALLHLVSPTAGEVRFRGRVIEPHDRAAMRAFRLACQLVFQDPFGSLDPRQRVVDIVREPLALLRGEARPAKDEVDRRVAEVLAEVGLDDPALAARLPHQLSGGQRQRVAIARALVRRPAFVVADEPVSALEASIQAQVLALFQGLQRRHGFACLFVSHDLAAVEQVAHRVVVMQAGRIVEQGTRDEVFDAPRHAYTRALLEAAPRIS